MKRTPLEAWGWSAEIAPQDARLKQPSRERIEDVLAVVAPGSRLHAVETPPGSYSNDTHLIHAVLPDGSTGRFILRRYKEFGDYDRGEKAIREFRALEHMAGHGVPVPAPLLLDPAGELLGSPGIVTAYVRGRQVDRPEDPVPWAEELGRVLAGIHNVKVDEATRRILLDANAEVTWFLKSPEPPPFMQAHPLGPMVWEWVRRAYPKRAPVPMGPVHVDYWTGNILWEGGKIAAVVDWEEAAWGDAEIDAAYLTMDLVLSGMGRAVDDFTRAYQAALGRPVRNLALWQLVAAARPMFSPEGWISEPPAVERFSEFVEAAMRKLDR